MADLLRRHVCTDGEVHEIAPINVRPSPGPTRMA